jgi:hypothetical protein
MSVALLLLPSAALAQDTIVKKQAKPTPAHHHVRHHQVSRYHPVRASRPAATLPSRETVVETAWGRIECKQGCRIHPDVSGTRFSVDTPNGKVQVARGGEWWLIQFPDQTVRVRQTERLSGHEEVLVQFKGQNYRIEQSQGEWEWKFPDDHAYFHYYAGLLRDAVGDRGAFKVQHSLRHNSYTVASETGESKFRLLKHKLHTSHHTLYQLETLSGQGAEKYPYLVKGVRFREGALSIFIAMPGGPLTAGLSESTVRTYTSDLAAEPSPIETSAPAANSDGPWTTRREAADPLRAADVPPGGKVLDASATRRSPDPMNLGNTADKRERTDVLRAQTGDDPAVLQVKEIDPSATPP